MTAPPDSHDVSASATEPEATASGASRWSMGASLAGMLGGAVLALAMLIPALAPVQVLGFVPVVWYLSSRRVRRDGVRGVLTMGACLGIGVSLPQVVVYLMPPWLGLILLAYYALILTFLAVAGYEALRCGGPVTGALGFAAAAVLADWANITLLPLWGTAQSLTRPWSAWPGLIQFVEFTGQTAILLPVAGLAALAVASARHPRMWVWCVVAGVLFAGASIAANESSRLSRRRPGVRVAAIGWLKETTWFRDLGIADERRFEELYAKPLRQAAEAGAKIVVSPELGFRFTLTEMPTWLGRFAALAREHACWLVVGYFNETSRQNRALVMDPAGQIRADYWKTRLTPVEHYESGPGETVTVDLPAGVRLGVLICQDDNYTDLTRSHGRRETALLAVPTSDWSAIKEPHFQSVIFRAIESRMTIVRAARNGHSAVISYRGEVRASKDHTASGAGFIVADTYPWPDQTLFDRYGHWPAQAAGIYLLGVVGWCAVRGAVGKRKRTA